MTQDLGNSRFMLGILDLRCPLYFAVAAVKNKAPRLRVWCVKSTAQTSRGEPFTAVI
ncbi:MAG: hypothetical protein MR582_03985 [Campylobacter sp.]|nr:hypothetical protein [Campylobacter sp.]